MRIELIALLVDQVAACRDFYRDVLGFPVRSEQGSYVEFATEGVRLALYSRAEMAALTGRPADAAPRGGLAVDLALPVPTFAEVDAAYQQATSRGARAVRPPGLMPWGQRIALIADPDGNLVEFFSDTP